MPADRPDDLLMFDGIHPDRVQCLNDAGRDLSNPYVLYWMERSQRSEWNHALEYAVQAANAMEMGVVVGFGLHENYPEANRRHLHFMMEGLLEVDESLKKRGIKFVVRRGDPVETCLELGADSSLIVCDHGYLRHRRKWRREVAAGAEVQVVQVESDLVVPVEIASKKREYAARTIRDQLLERYSEYLEFPGEHFPETSSLRYSVDYLPLHGVEEVLSQIDADRSVPPSKRFKGGTSNAKQLFREFLDDRLHQYGESRSDPNVAAVSYQSMYLHMGQISPCYLLDELSGKRSRKNKAAYVEELIVRRELAHNFVYYTPEHYDSFSALPDWAAESLAEHKSDDRPDIHTREELENGETPDEYWNAAMARMKEEGYLHNHMRMYWGKQILKWTNTPEYAYQTALYLNNKYFLDGRDANSYANILWLFGLHDRAWKERDIYGKVRIMTPNGLERKVDIEEFVEEEVEEE